MNKTICALISAGTIASATAYAALPTDAAPFQIVVPNLQSGFDITLEGLYLQPTNSDLDYVSVTTSETNAQDDISYNTDTKSVSPNNHFGFRVGLGYTFPDSGNDIQLSWLRYRNTDSSNVSLNDEGSITSRLNETYNVGPVAGIYVENRNVKWIYNSVEATSEAKFGLDAIDLDVGQYIDVGTRLRLRLFAGLRVAQLNNKQTTSENAQAESSFYDEYTIGDTTFTTEGDFLFDSQYTETFDAKFTGIGPRLGIDSSYHLGKGFGVVTQISAALLVGKADSTTTASRVYTQQPSEFEECIYEQNSSRCITNTFPGTQTQQSFSIESQNTSRIVPAIDARLGLNYSHTFDNDSIVTIEGGYQATQYINAIDRLTTDAPPLEEAAVDQSVQVTRTTSSLGFSGPYLSLNWKV